MKFALDFADKYKMPAVRLEPDARTLLEAYRWPGNIRQLKNVAEQISVLESNRQVSADVLKKYLPVDEPNRLPVRNCDSGTAGNIQDRDIIFKMLFQLREEVDELKAMIGRPDSNVPEIPQVHAAKLSDIPDFSIVVPSAEVGPVKEETPLTIHDMNDDMIRKALEKHEGRRKAAAAELGISERTLYRKIGIYSFSGTSIQPDVKTIAVEYFQNNALKVNPTLAANLTDALIDQYRRLTSLDILAENGDMNVSGEITSYDTRPMAVTADEVASQNRLTVNVKIYFTNRLHPEEDFEKSFSAYADYDSNQLLDAVESSLCDEIIDILVEDIFNATVANW